MRNEKKQPIVEDGLLHRVKRLTAVFRAAAETALRGTEPGVSNAALARRSYVTPQTTNVLIQGLATAGLVSPSSKRPRSGSCRKKRARVSRPPRGLCREHRQRGRSRAKEQMTP